MGNKVGYIYIMTSKSFFDHDCVKIGYSDDVEARRKQLSKKTDLLFEVISQRILYFHWFSNLDLVFL